MFAADDLSLFSVKFAEITDNESLTFVLEDIKMSASKSILNDDNLGD